MTEWNRAELPPEGKKNLWSRDVVAVTNLGSVLRAAYFNGDHGGVWQRPRDMVEGEEIVAWADFPAFE